MGGVATKLIEKNTHIPTKKSQIFSTAADNQTSTEIHITQGERAQATDNKSLGRFVLDGIPPAPRGVPQVEVTFDVDSSGVLNVTATDKSTGKEQSIRIEANSGLTEDDIEKMKADAETHAEEDTKKKEIIEARNLADQMIYTAEKAVKDHGEAAGTELVEAINKKIAGVKEVKDKDDKSAIETATEALSTEMQKIGEIMQKAAATESTSESNNDNSQSEETVRDAEVSEENDADKPKQ
jgi:molecular chaperone DnaK